MKAFDKTEFDAQITQEDEGKALYRFLHASEQKVKVGLTEGQKRALESSKAAPQPS
jgi:hypothetical protein